MAANRAALDAGHVWGETAELPSEVSAWRVPRARLAAGTYRNVTGSQALSWGLLAGAQKARLGLSFCGYPITPASVLLHNLAALKKFGVVTFQAEDEIAAICAAIGASYAGSLGVTASSGPGLALKTEALGLAIATELPLVVVNAQRGGPSTGLPTKTEQSDLYQAVWGRNGDAPLAVLATRSPADCFEVAIEAVRIATTWMTPSSADRRYCKCQRAWRSDGRSRFQLSDSAACAGPMFHPYAGDPAPWPSRVRPDAGLGIALAGWKGCARATSPGPASHGMTDVARKIAILGTAADLVNRAGEGSAGRRLGFGTGPISRAVSTCARPAKVASFIRVTSGAASDWEACRRRGSRCRK